MSNTLHRSDSCSTNKEVYVANNHLIGDTCTVISTLQNFSVKIFSWGTIENYIYKCLTHEYFYTQKFPSLRYKLKPITVAMTTQ